MTITLFAFYLFSITAVMSALFVVVARNPVHSVLWLILTFFSAASMFVLMGAEFVAMLLAIVYVLKDSQFHLNWAKDSNQANTA